MGALLDFFAGGTARIQALLVGALAMAAVCLALTAYGLWWRSEAYQARGERDVAIAQARALAAGIEACSAGVAAAQRAALNAVSTGRELLAQAQRLARPAIAEAKRIEELLKQKPPARADGKQAGCDDAWDEIEGQGAR